LPLDRVPVVDVRVEVKVDAAPQLPRRVAQEPAERPRLTGSDPLLERRLLYQQTHARQEQRRISVDPTRFEYAGDGLGECRLLGAMSSAMSTTSFGGCSSSGPASRTSLPIGAPITSRERPMLNRQSPTNA
jgi:hypothetical protein